MSRNILATHPGKAVKSMNDGGVGGFSWAFGRARGGGAEMVGVTRISEYYGMDFVNRPNFSANRGYVLEDAGDEDRDRVMGILEGADVADTEAFISAWGQGALLAQVSPGIMESLIGDNHDLLTRIEAMSARSATESEKSMQKKIEAVRGITPNLRVAMPENVQVALARMSGEADIHAVREYLNAVAALDPNKYPLGERGSDFYVSGENLARRSDQGVTSEYGDPSMAPKFYAREGAISF